MFSVLSGDAVWANRRERLHPGFPVPFLSRAGVCCRLGQCDSKTEMKSCFAGVAVLLLVLDSDARE